jgi:Flp pilus assembly protein TadG
MVLPINSQPLRCSGATIVKRREKGAAAVEFALVAVLFFTAFFSILDFGYLAWVNLTMQHAVRSGARLAISGDTIAPATNCQNSVINKMTEQSMGLWNKVVIGQPTFSNLCGAGGVMVITVNCTVTPFSPLIQKFFTGGNYTFNVSATMVNEG